MRNFFKALFFGRESDSCAFMLRWKTLNSSARHEVGEGGDIPTPDIRTDTATELETHNSLCGNYR